MPQAKKPSKKDQPSEQSSGNHAPPELSLEDIKSLTLDQKVYEVQTRLSWIEKTSEVKFKTTNYKAMQEHILFEAVNPLLRQFRLTQHVSLAKAEDAGVVPIVRQGNHVTLVVRFKLVNIDAGNDHLIELYTGEGVDQADKASAKALTMASKYAIQKFWQIATEKIDDADDISTAEHEDKGTTRQPDAKPGKKTITKKEQEVISAQLKDAVDQGHLTTERIKAQLQGSFDVEHIKQLSADEAEAFTNWVSEEVKSD
jgi:hypothetical protein